LRFIILTWLVLIAWLPLSAQDAEISGWGVNLEGATVTNDTTTAKKVRVFIPGIMGETDLIIPDVVFTGQGFVTKSGVGKTPTELRGTNGFRILAMAYQFSQRGLALAGQVFLPDTMSQDSVTYQLGEMWLEPDGALVTEVSPQKVRYKYLAYNAEGTGIRFDRNGMSIGKGLLVIPSSKGLPLGEQVFYADGRLMESSGSEGETTIVVNNLKAIVSDPHFTEEEGLQFSGQLFLPPPFDALGLYVDSMGIDGGGRLYMGSSVHDEVWAEFQGFRFSASRLRGNSQDGFNLDGVQIWFPEALVEQPLQVQYMALGPDGTLNLNGFSTPAISLGGLPVVFDHLKFSAEGFEGDGGFRMPKDFPDGLDSWWVKMTLLTIDPKGVLTQFVAKSERELEVALNDNWYLSESRLETSVPPKSNRVAVALVGGSIYLSSALALPGLYELKLTKLPVDLEGSRLDVTKVELEPLHFSAWGLTFDLKLTKVSPAFDLTFSGTATVSDAALAKVPKALEGKSLGVQAFQMTGGGTWGNLLFSGADPKTSSFSATVAKDHLEWLAYEPGAGSKISFRAVTNADVALKDTPSSTGKTLKVVTLGEVFVVSEQSPTLDNVDGRNDRWYLVSGNAGKGWLFGSGLDRLK
jgi:hypothetical protein